MDMRQDLVYGSNVDQSFSTLSWLTDIVSVHRHRLAATLRTWSQQQFQATIMPFPYDLFPSPRHHLGNNTERSRPYS